MSTVKAALLGLLIPLAATAPGFAQDDGERGPRMTFEAMDTNGDGAVTLEELQARGEARFAETDTDGDGALTRDELIAASQDRMAERMAERVDRMIERADANDDGQLSQEELAEMRDDRRGPNPERIFERMDADEDGQVTEAEFEEAMERFQDRRGGGHRHGGGERDRG